MGTLETFGQRQQYLLQLLLQHRSGLTVDKLALDLEISRNAVNQHLASLENGGYVKNALLTSTGGRPGKIYSLTESGLELFPRHYSLVSQLLIEWIIDNYGVEELDKCLKTLGQQLANQLKSQLPANGSSEDKIQQVIRIMQDLGYAAQAELSPVGSTDIVARNCVFHQLASKNDAVCQLDLSLLSTLLDAEIDHKECMVKGGLCCRFGIKKFTSTH